MSTFDEKLTKTLQDNLLISWIEPDDDPKDVVVWFASAQDCVKMSKEYAGGRYVYKDDEEALYEFIVVHWGWIDQQEDDG